MGEVEIEVIELIILNVLKVFFFIIEVESDGGDDLCMKYCYFDLCCGFVQENIMFCSCLVIEICKYLLDEGFLEIEMLFFIKSMLEGVCDFVVFFCMNFGQFYVLL